MADECKIRYPNLSFADYQKMTEDHTYEDYKDWHDELLNDYFDNMFSKHTQPVYNWNGEGLWQGDVV